MSARPPQGSSSPAMADGDALGVLRAARAQCRFLTLNAEPTARHGLATAVTELAKELTELEMLVQKPQWTRAKLAKAHWVHCMLCSYAATLAGLAWKDALLAAAPTAGDLVQDEAMCTAAAAAAEHTELAAAAAPAAANTPKRMVAPSAAAAAEHTELAAAAAAAAAADTPKRMVAPPAAACGAAPAAPHPAATLPTLTFNQPAAAPPPKAEPECAPAGVWQEPPPPQQKAMPTAQQNEAAGPLL